MILLQQGRSYLWLFFALGTLLLGGYAACDVAGHPRWGSSLLPAIITLLTSGQLLCGVALDSWWRASYPSGTENYWLSLVVQALFAGASMVFMIL